MNINLQNYNDQEKHEKVLIHIGKCGGSSLRRAIKDSSKLKITGLVHVDKPFVMDQDYYIVARDPIERCISAFNWRYKLVVTDEVQKARFTGEFDILTKYKTLNGLAEELYDASGSLNALAAKNFESIHHLYERISFYLEDFLQNCPVERIKGVFMQETLNDDIEKYLGVPKNNVQNIHENVVSMGHDLSPLGRKNLTRYIEKDYCCLFTLYNLGHIDKVVMQKIFNNAFS